MDLVTARPAHDFRIMSCPAASLVLLDLSTLVQVYRRRYPLTIHGSVRWLQRYFLVVEGPGIRNDGLLESCMGLVAAGQCSAWFLGQPLIFQGLSFMRIYDCWTFAVLEVWVVVAILWLSVDTVSRHCTWRPFLPWMWGLLLWNLHWGLRLSDRLLEGLLSSASRWTDWELLRWKYSLAVLFEVCVLVIKIIVHRPRVLLVHETPAC